MTQPLSAEPSSILVVNVGTTSVKSALFLAPALPGDDMSSLAHVEVAGVGQSPGGLELQLAGQPAHLEERSVADFTEAIDLVVRTLREHIAGLDTSLRAVGHRVVHGAHHYRSATFADEAVERQIEALAPLAPLHNPANLAGMRRLRQIWPDVPHVAVFDTAFHHTLPVRAYKYAVPRDLAARLGLRRWGFQGISVRAACRLAAEALGIPPEAMSTIVCHLGSGASVTAVEQGRSVDTSMGMTPLEGLVMGTRSGDVDPALPTFLIRQAGLGADDVDRVLEQQSGLLGLAGTSDLREVRRRADSGDQDSAEALEVYSYRIRKYLGAYRAVLPDLRSVVFTGGVGANDPRTRAEILLPLAHLGFFLDERANASALAPATPLRIDRGGIPLLVVRADEERQIAREVTSLLRAG
jgi:acetate kinase